MTVDPALAAKAAMVIEVEAGKLFGNKLVLPFWLSRFEAALEPEAVLDAPEVAENDEEELCRVMVC